MTRHMKDVLLREPGSDRNEREEKPLSWETGIPMLSNPFVLIEFIIFALFIWIVVTGIGVIAIFGLSGVFTIYALWLAIKVGGFAALMFSGVFVLVSLLFFSNRFYGRFYLDREGVLYVTVRGRAVSHAPLFATRPFPVSDLDVTKRAEKRVYWNRVDTIEPFEKWRVIGLKKKNKTVLRLYCPDKEIYDRALTRCIEAVKK
ncbi:MAG: hypothetical protein WCQ97_07535 [Aminobacterium sp.]|jgi:hypothetical protein|uniref:hypothetical protein n=1 Tax=unclassified Aminobacterium TaxID=2685012 RepID=UPI001BD16376|nr:MULTISPECIES: hypothetical protein [unclassified Aminobacterium]MDD2206342.1 hypothetical protein [Aminobacterium sp.]MDD3425846.1 hypothetical protein [Aminobacterium sp.]MDD3708505.1 hypothetical protein [Aminobacterium sp.]MDD4228359.1 hypothetical protein [Aminobacterium sp.]MDD4551830.1 hypothetical protein [Aminobacterium sp.]